MSAMARSGRCSRIRARSPGGSWAWPTTSNPARSSRLAIPSRSRMSSSASTMRILASPISPLRLTVAEGYSHQITGQFPLVRGTGMGPRGAPGTRGFRRRRGRLTRRTVAVSVLLSAIIGSAFFLLMLAIEGLRDSESKANHSLKVLISESRLERLVIDVETSQRGFIITGDTRFLRPWYQARAALAREAADLERLASAGDAGESTRARRITHTAGSYIKDYAVPPATPATPDLGSARTVVETEEGKRSVDALRGRFERFMASERQMFRTGEEQADAAARRATVAATVSVAGSIVLILLSGGYLARSVVRPVRRASAMADRAAGGDLAVRTPETGPGEVGILERAFNSMAGSLETSTYELRRIAEEQAALRQVATLVARAVSPPEVFSAVAAETGRVLGADCTTVARFEPEGSVTIVGSWAKPGAPGLAPPLGSRWPAEEASVSGRGARARGPASRGYEKTPRA